MSKFPSFGGGGGSSLAEGGAAAAIIGKIGQIGDEFKQIDDHISGRDQEYTPGVIGSYRGIGGFQGGSLTRSSPTQAGPRPTGPPVVPRQRIAQVDNALSRAAQSSNNQESRGFTVDGDGDVFMLPGPPPPGTLLPLDADWTVEEDALQRAIRRDRFQRGARNVVIAGLGGVTANEAYQTWKQRAEWAVKNSGTPYEATFPVGIPSDGAGDLDPSMKPPELPNYPSQTNPRAPQERTSSNWLQPVNNAQRAVFVGGSSSKNDCAC
jgi:hypothetical protein